ncbi:MAG: hypothetical protein NTX50_27105 [Candidatus Sumerlaeota bacterium]|nr:hypothetical protein [Candidatus Sumerlaeota bacterium]
MIGYPKTLKELETRAGSKWLDKAKSQRQKSIRSRKCIKSLWSEIKPIFMEIQGNGKCAFCERKLESVEYGRIEQDVEHFRPKNGVKAWTLPNELKRLPFGSVPKNNHGYYWLGYHLHNYAAACKPCNTCLKGTAFPIAGKYGLNTRKTPAELHELEKPYLIYPLGDFDDAPEQLIEFCGLSPRPRFKTGHKRNRARVTIAFFHLDDMERGNLFLERARTIMLLRKYLPGKDSDSLKVVEKLESSSAPHTNCAQSFHRLFNANRDEAAEAAQDAERFLLSKS